MAGRHYSGYEYRDPAADNPIYRFFSTIQSWNPTVLRLVLGAVFVCHGGQSAFGWFNGGGWTESITRAAAIGIPVYLAAAGVLAEVAGAIGLILGCFTRLASLAILTVVVIPFCFASLPKPWPEIEPAFVLGGMAFALILSGGGNFSLDKELSKQLLP